MLPRSIAPLSQGGEFYAIDKAAEQGLSLGAGALPQQDFADWFLYCARVLNKREQAERFATLSMASALAMQGTTGRPFTRAQVDAFPNELSTACEYLELDRDAYTARAVLVIAFLNAVSREASCG